MSLDKNNKAYENLGMSDFMKSRIYDRCMEKGEEEKDEMIVNSFGASLDDTRNRDVTTIVLDSSELVRVRKKSSKYEMIMKCVASVAFIAVLSSLVFFGKKYYDGINDENVALKSATTEKTDDDLRVTFNIPIKQDEEEELEDYFRSNVSDYLFENYDDSNIQPDDYKKYVNECYDSEGKLKKGYEVREFDLKSNGETVNKIKLVGKDFIFISAEEAKKNVDKIKKDFIADYEDKELEVARKITDEYGNEFAAHDYVYYLQGPNMIRVRLDAIPVSWIDNGDCYEYLRNKYSYYKHIGLKKVDGKVLAYVKKIEVDEMVMDVDTLNSFDDVNITYGNVFQIIDKESEKEIKDIKYLYIKPAYQSEKNVLYYIDPEYNLWRIKNVKLYKQKEEMSSEGYKNNGLVEYVHKNELSGQIDTIFGVDKDYKAEKIAENVCFEEYYGEEDDVSMDYHGGFVLRENIEAYKKDGFKKLIDDEHVIYKEVKE